MARVLLGLWTREGFLKEVTWRWSGPRHGQGKAGGLITKLGWANDKLISPTWVVTGSCARGGEDPDFVPWVILAGGMDVCEIPKGTARYGGGNQGQEMVN